MIQNYKGVEDIIAFSDVVQRLREFCLRQRLRRSPYPGPAQHPGRMRRPRYRRDI
jgi:hypothetical protein